MRAVTIVDGDLAWLEHPDPAPGAHELLVEVRAAGLNGADMLQRQGRYPAPAGSPADIPGLELAGEVVATGPGCSRFAVGDRVMAVVGGGGQAELAVVHERVAMPVPDIVAPGRAGGVAQPLAGERAGGVAQPLPWDQAGGFPEVFTTAYDALFSQCDLALGERLLVNGAAGGVGTAAVQLGSAAGATVVGTSRRPEQRQAVASLSPGVTAVAPGELAGRGPFDVILELVGAPNIEEDLAVLATGGRLAVVGVGAGHRAEIDLRALMQVRGRVHGSTLRARPLEDKAQAARAVEAHVLPLLRSGRVLVPVAATFPMDQAGAAYDHFTAGGKVGKVVLVTRP